MLVIRMFLFAVSLSIDLATISRAFPDHALALQLPFMQFSESIGNHDSKIVDAASVD